MSDIYRFSESEILLFFMVLMRMASFVVSVGRCSERENLSNLLKVLFALIVTLVIFPHAEMALQSEQAQALHSDLILLAARGSLYRTGAWAIPWRACSFSPFCIAAEMLSQAKWPKLSPDFQIRCWVARRRLWNKCTSHVGIALLPRSERTSTLFDFGISLFVSVGTGSGAQAKHGAIHWHYSI